MRLTRAELRQRFRELRDLVNQWDPAGVFSVPDWPVDEYECMVGPILRQLEGGASVEGLADYLVHEFHDHFGTGPTRDAAAVWARGAQEWFTSHWPESAPVPRSDG